METEILFKKKHTTYLRNRQDGTKIHKTRVPCGIFVCFSPTRLLITSVRRGFENQCQKFGQATNKWVPNWIQRSLEPWGEKGVLRGLLLRWVDETEGR